MMEIPISEAYKKYRSSIVPDAGAGHLVRQPHGHPGEVYRCPSHTGPACELCGGAGYRAVCDSTACHEYGCQSGTCGRSEDDFKRGQHAAKPPTAN
jgi:hypothetical protein